MRKFQKEYDKLIGRSLLLAGYFFLFAGQFNFRYFTIANFYVYHNNDSFSNGAGDAAHLDPGSGAVMAVSPTATRQQPVVLRDNSQRPSHLGIDKRFQGRQSIRVPQIRAPQDVVYFQLLNTRFYSFAAVYFSTDPPTGYLRGPPCA